MMVPMLIDAFQSAFGSSCCASVSSVGDGSSTVEPSSAAFDVAVQPLRDAFWAVMEQCSGSACTATPPSLQSMKCTARREDGDGATDENSDHVMTAFVRQLIQTILLHGHSSASPSSESSVITAVRLFLTEVMKCCIVRASTISSDILPALSLPMPPALRRIGTTKLNSTVDGASESSSSVRFVLSSTGGLSPAALWPQDSRSRRSIRSDSGCGRPAPMRVWLPRPPPPMDQLFINSLAGAPFPEAPPSSTHDTSSLQSTSTRNSHRSMGMWVHASRPSLSVGGGQHDGGAAAPVGLDSLSIGMLSNAERRELLTMGSLMAVTRSNGGMDPRGTSVTTGGGIGETGTGSVASSMTVMTPMMMKFDDHARFEVATLSAGERHASADPVIVPRVSITPSIEPEVEEHAMCSTTSQQHQREPPTTQRVMVRTEQSPSYPYGDFLKDFPCYTVNQYALLESVGKGNQGEVFSCLDMQTGLQRAIKVIPRPSHLLGSGPVGALRKNIEAARKLHQLEREVAIMKRCRHRNILGLYEVIDDPEHDDLYLVMQLAKGSLMQITPSGDATAKFAIRDIIRFGQQLCSGLKYLHDRGIVHRDIKPANILVGDDDAVMLGDFGISGMLRHQHANEMKQYATTTPGGSDATAATQVNGTPAFLAPELFKERDDDAVKTISGDVFNAQKRADVWALGMMLYVAKYGRMPWPLNVPCEQFVRAVMNAPILFDNEKQGSSDTSGFDNEHGKCDNEQRAATAGDSTPSHSGSTSTASNQLSLSDTAVPHRRHPPTMTVDDILRGMLHRDPQQRWGITKCLRHFEKLEEEINEADIRLMKEASISALPIDILEQQSHEAQACPM